MTAKKDSLIEELFAAQAHLGHKTNRIHPKSKKYIYTIENGVSIIDLSQTEKLLEKALEYLASLKKDGKILLVVATKKIAADKIEEMCKLQNISFITTKWPAGLLTNFETMKRNIKKLSDMNKSKNEGEWKKLVKHEQSRLSRELSKLERHYGGLVNIVKIPDAILVVDIKKEKNAIKEAGMMKVPLIAIVDTNVDPNEVQYPVPANDDSLSSVEFIMQKLIDAYSLKK